MKFQWRCLLIVPLLIVLSGCSSPVSTSEPEPSPSSAELPAATPTGQTYPYPAQSYPLPEQIPYPLSGQELPAQDFQYPYPLQGSAPYPAPQEPQEVPYEQVKVMIQNGEVAQVFQAHDLTVILTLKDGRRYISTQPEIDDIFILIDECGEPCVDIVRITE